MNEIKRSEGGKKSLHSNTVDKLIVELLADFSPSITEVDGYLAINRSCVSVIQKIRKAGIWQQYLDADLQSIFLQAISDAYTALAMRREESSDDGGSLKLKDLYVRAVHRLIAEGVREFDVLIPLPALPIPEEEIFFCDGLILSKESKLKFGLTTEVEFPGVGDGAELTVLKMRMSGYTHFTSSHSLSVKVLSKLREFLTLAELLGLFKRVPDLRLLEFGASPQLSIIAEPLDGSGYRKILSERRSLYNCLSALVLGSRESEGSIDIFEGEVQQSPYVRYQDIFSKIGTLVSRPEDDPDLMQIRRAIHWAFEAELADDVSVAMVQAFVALESLLTDSQASNNAGQIAARLAERYAYLVGSTFTDRAKKVQELIDLYKIRGNLLHGKVERSEMDAAHSRRWDLHRLVGQTLLAEIDRLLP